MEFPKIKNVKVHEISNDAQIITGQGLKILKLMRITYHSYQK